MPTNDKDIIEFSNENETIYDRNTDNKIIIYGVGKMAEFIYYSFKNDSEYDVVAFCVDDAYLQNSEKTLFDLPVLGFSEIQINFPPDNHLVHIAIGRNSARSLIFEKVHKAGYSFANYICSKANVWPDLEIGRNVFIDQASIIHPYVKIGDNCILIKAGIGHHSTIGSDNLLSGTSLAGNVTIGKNCFLGLNSAIKESVQIGNNNIIGAACFISKNILDNTIIYQERSVQKKIVSKNITLFNGN
jgi:sugar O-acyltransferase (sialic acid O-acetyltransferase NeuD family)